MIAGVTGTVAGENDTINSFRLPQFDRQFRTRRDPACPELPVDRQFRAVGASEILGDTTLASA